MLKLKPLEDYVGEDEVTSYVAIRADEDRDGYISTKPNFKAVYPFKEAGITEPDVRRLLDDSGLGLPKYYEWRTRSGCYFCFFQRRAEWIGLKERHPDLFEKAKAYEKEDPESGRRYTWSQRESLDELEQPERLAEIKEKHEKAMKENAATMKGQRLYQILGTTLDEEDDTEPCLICHL